MPYSVGGNDERGYHVTDPNGHITPVGSRDSAESYAQQQNQLLRQSTSGYIPTESFTDTLKSCAALIIGTIIIVVLVALIANFIILHVFFH